MFFKTNLVVLWPENFLDGNAKKKLEANFNNSRQPKKKETFKRILIRKCKGIQDNNMQENKKQAIKMSNETLKQDLWVENDINSMTLLLKKELEKQTEHLLSCGNEHPIS